MKKSHSLQWTGTTSAAVGFVMLRTALIHYVSRKWHVIRARKSNDVIWTGTARYFCRVPQYRKAQAAGAFVVHTLMELCTEDSPHNLLSITSQCSSFSIKHPHNHGSHLRIRTKSELNTGLHGQEPPDPSDRLSTLESGQGSLRRHRPVLPCLHACSRLPACRTGRR